MRERERKRPSGGMRVCVCKIDRQTLAKDEKDTVCERYFERERERESR